MVHPAVLLVLNAPIVLAMNAKLYSRSAHILIPIFESSHETNGIPVVYGRPAHLPIF
jgi:hypothetical protein